MSKLLLLLPLMAGCATSPYMAYKADSGDEWNTNCPEEGDCEDYALCVSRNLDGKGYLVVTSYKGKDHAVLVHGGDVYDILDVKGVADLGGSLACNLETGKAGIFTERRFIPFRDPPAMPFIEKCLIASQELRHLR